MGSSSIQPVKFQSFAPLAQQASQSDPSLYSENSHLRPLEIPIYGFWQWIKRRALKRNDPPSEKQPFFAAVAAVTTTSPHQANFFLDFTHSAMAWTEALFQTLHLYPLGPTLPWWITIVVGTLILRSTVTLPLAIIQKQRTFRLVHHVSPILKAWNTALFKAPKLQHALATAENPLVKFRSKQSELLKLYRCNPRLTMVLPFTQIPLFILTSLALRHMAAFPVPFLETPPLPVEGFSEGGLSWFVDLTAPDPTMIFPFVLGAIHHINANNQFGPFSALSRGGMLLKLVVQGISLLMVLLATQVPMALTLYWTTSAAFSTAQHALLAKMYPIERDDKVRLSELFAKANEVILVPPPSASEGKNV